MQQNSGDQFDKVPATSMEQRVSGRPSRREIILWWEDRFGIPDSVFDSFSFWEKGNGKIWIVSGELDGPIAIEALGMRCLRVRQKFWKPTTNAIQRFGGYAKKNRVLLSSSDASRFVRGDSISGEWRVDDGYVIVMRGFGAQPVPIGVGLLTSDELRSQIPKGRRRELSE